MCIAGTSAGMSARLRVAGFKLDLNLYLFSGENAFVARGDRKTTCNRTGNEWIVERNCRPPGPRIASYETTRASAQGHLRALSHLYTPYHHQETR